MKNIVLVDELHEAQLKPAPLFKRYCALTEKDVRRFFSTRLSKTNCPACHSSQTELAFRRFGLSYQECKKCRSVFISPRPSDQALRDYYCGSQARRYWRDTLSRKTTQTRKEKMVKPRLEWINESTQEYLPGALSFADINTSHYGYCDELADNDYFSETLLIDPFLLIEKMNRRNLSVVPNPWWKASFHQELDVVSLFEVCDRTADVDALLQSVKSMLKKDGLVFMTAILISGFDLQVLWDKADNLFPPDRLNAFSVEGIQALIKRHHFECLEFSTPGVLDVTKIEKAFKACPKMPMPRFTRYLFEHRDENTKKALQEFLQASLLSSYCRLVLRKK